MKTTAAPPITPEIRSALATISRRSVGCIDVAPPDLMGSVLADVMLNSGQFAYGGASINDAKAAARALSQASPIGQAFAVVEPAQGAFYLSPAFSSTRGSYGTAAGPTVPLALEADFPVDRQVITKDDALKALVDYSRELAVERGRF